MISEKVMPTLGLITGILLALVGVYLIVLYVLEAVIARIGEPDQSLLFWYSPFLLFGLIGLRAGLRLGIPGFKRLRQLRQKEG